MTDILDLIDGALDASGDAMRWAPPESHDTVPRVDWGHWAVAYESELLSDASPLEAEAARIVRVGTEGGYADDRLHVHMDNRNAVFAVDVSASGDAALTVAWRDRMGQLRLEPLSFTISGRFDDGSTMGHHLEQALAYAFNMEIETYRRQMRRRRWLSAMRAAYRARRR